ncbi:Rrf2 family transcriptional regulator [Candidatus Nitrotoga fabula]|uniref:DNA-binding transcriptional dual regulator IscR n=1 Tax=Candidatus Nitrotoga fabula TaxID=2182327 RepID=A0A916BCJ6_9PROT|nr:Rrf2 family transcriptional regulator [Candidatus Nitrotoga fabula]CAE6720194.1 DNA-binding transcriptional dual regulator IscR [Candidatus Nitrotoga fabula]
MRLTTKGRFAVMAMADLALHSGLGPVTLSSISERQKISQSYLDQLFGKLRKRNIVVAVRGPGGGYCLARPSAQISVADIVVAVDESVDATRCGGKANCHDEKQCITHDLWMGLNEALYGYMSGVSLQQLVDGVSRSKSEVKKVIVSQNVTKPALASV